MNELMKLRDELVEIRDIQHPGFTLWPGLSEAIKRIDAALIELNYHSLRLAGYSE